MTNNRLAKINNQYTRIFLCLVILLSCGLYANLNDEYIINSRAYIRKMFEDYEDFHLCLYRVGIYKREFKFFCKIAGYNLEIKNIPTSIAIDLDRKYEIKGYVIGRKILKVDTIFVKQKRIYKIVLSGITALIIIGLFFNQFKFTKRGFIPFNRA